MRNIIIIGVLLLLSEAAYSKVSESMVGHIIAWKSAIVFNRIDYSLWMKKVRGLEDEVPKKQLLPMVFIEVRDNGRRYRYEKQAAKLKQRYSPAQVREQFFSLLLSRSKVSCKKVIILDSERRYTHKHISKINLLKPKGGYFTIVRNYHILENLLPHILERDPRCIFQIETVGVLYAFFIADGKIYVGYNELDGWAITDKVRIQPAHEFLQTFSDDEIYDLLTMNFQQ